MIKSVKITNYVGESVEIVLTDDKPTHGLLIKKIDGLGPSASNLSKTPYGIIPGSHISNSNVIEKNIVITFLLANDVITVEDARINTYRYMPVNTEVKLQITTDNGVFEINGLVESNEPDIFSKEETVEVSILCPSPFFVKVANGGESDDYTVPFTPEGPQQYGYAYIENDTNEQLGVEVSLIVTSDNHQGLGYIIVHDTTSTPSKYMVLSVENIKLLFPDFEGRWIQKGDKITFYHLGDVNYCRYYYYKSYDTDLETGEPINIAWYEPKDVTSALVQNDEIYVNPMSTHQIAFNTNNIGYLYLRGTVNYTKGAGNIGTVVFANNTCSFEYNGEVEAGGVWTIKFLQSWTVSGTSATFSIRDGKGESLVMDLVKIFKIANDQSKTFLANDIIELSTVDGDKHLIFKRGNAVYNILDACGAVEYTWPRLYYGSNELRLTGIDAYKIEAVIEYGELHGGV